MKHKTKNKTNIQDSDFDDVNTKLWWSESERKQGLSLGQMLMSGQPGKAQFRTFRWSPVIMAQLSQSQELIPYM